MAILYGEIDKETKREKIHYNRGDVVSSETINDIQDTAIDAHNMATEALDKADSVFQGNGTVVSVGDREVGTLAFSSDPQQQLDTLNAKITTSSSFNAEIVDQLPTTNISTSTFYLIKNSTSADDNTYSEYLYVNGKWELLGNTQVQAYDDSELRELINGLSTTKANKTDLANYYTKDQTYNTTEVDAKVINLVSTSYLKSELNPIKTDVNTNKTNIATLQTDIVGKADKADLNNYTKTSDLAKVATSNDYNDLDNTPNTDLMVEIINEHSDSINEINTELAGKANKSEIPSISGLASESYVNIQVNTLQGKIDGKQDTISDLATIRSGASAGATAVQPSALDGYYTKAQTENRLNAEVSNINKTLDRLDTSTTTNLNSIIELDERKVNKATTINSKPLSSNITLTASDVGALPSTTTLFSGNYNDLTNKPTIPTTASQVGALPNTTKYGASLSLTMNTSTYVVTAQLKDQAGNNLGTAQTIDLPLESVVVSGSYDATSKKVILTLKDGSTIDFSVEDLIDGLASTTYVDTEIDRVEGLIAQGGGTAVSVAGNPVATLEFDSNPQTQINNKLSKSTTANSVYGVSSNGTQMMYDLTPNITTGGTVVVRDPNGGITCANPSTAKQAVNKDYLETELSYKMNNWSVRPNYIVAGDANSYPADSNVKLTDLATKSEIPDITGKADKVSGATANNLASLGANGNLQDSGIAKNNVAQSNKIGIFGTLNLSSSQQPTGSAWDYIKINYDSVSTNDSSIFDLYNNGIRYKGTKPVYAKVTHTLVADLGGSTLYGFAVYKNATQVFDCKKNTSAQAWGDAITNSKIIQLNSGDTLIANFISGGKTTTLWAWASYINVEILGEV